MHLSLRLAGTALALVVLFGCGTNGRRAQGEADHPKPTEHWLEERAEGSQKQNRKRWMEHMHAAADGVDWRAIERNNGRREMRRRNAMAETRALTQTSWTEVGSRNQAGRIHCMSVSPSSASTIYAGSDRGGVWRGTVQGTGWTPLADNLYGGAQWLGVLPGETAGAPDIIVAATDGGAVHVTRDDGLTWESPSGLPALSSCRGLAVLNDAQHTVLVYGQYNPGGTRPGVFASTDGARTFTNRWTGSLNHAGWMWVPRKGSGAASHVYVLQRGQLLVSTNAGVSFTPAAVIDATASRSVLAGSEAGAPTLYAALQVGGQWKLYRSDNAGTSFSFTTNMSDVWEGTLCASSVDPSIVMYGGVEAWRSLNSGTSFTKVNSWGQYYGDPAHKLHADIPGIFVIPDPNEPIGSELWFVGTDGGLYISSDACASVNNLSLTGLGVSQYYSTLTAHNAPSLILAGSQDQGYQRGTYAPPSGPGPSTDFAQLISGDYGHLTSSDGNHSVVYSCYPGFVLVQQGQNSPQLGQVDFPPSSVHAWLPPLLADPLSLNAFFFSADKLWRYTKVGNTWTPTQHSTFDFLAGNAAYISALGISRTDTNRMYAVNDRGRLFYSASHGVNWTEAAGGAPPPHYFYGNALAVHPSDALEAVVGGSGYSNPGVQRTLDGGNTWSPLATGLPPTLVYDLAYAEDGSGDVFAATEAGAFRWVRSQSSWTNVMQSGTPITTYWSVEIVDGGATARFGTYGRGIWDYAIQPSGAQASWVRYGENLGGVNVMFIDSQTLPHIGTSVTLDVSNLGGGPHSGWVFSSDFGGAVPNYFGGTLLVDPISGFIPLKLLASGNGSVSFRIPNEPQLIGTSRYYQAMVLDGASAQGILLSNGIEARFGP